MKALAALTLFLSLAAGAAEKDFWHPQLNNNTPGTFWHPAPSANDSFWHPAPNQAVTQHHPVVRNPLWRRPVAVRNPHRFRFRNQVFVVIGAPLYAAPWLSYPYAVGTPWGPSYYVPGESGYFLYFCPDPAGYYPEVQSCPAGWLQSVPDDTPGMDPQY